MGRRLRRRESGRVPHHQPTRHQDLSRRVYGLLAGVRVLLAPTCDRRGLHLHGADPRHGRTLDREDRAGVRDLFSRGFRDTMIVMIPAAAGYIVLAGPIVALLAGHGAVRGVELPILARTLAGFAIGLP